MTRLKQTLAPEPAFCVVQLRPIAIVAAASAYAVTTNRYVPGLIDSFKASPFAAVDDASGSPLNASQLALAGYAASVNAAAASATPPDDVISLHGTSSLHATNAAHTNKQIESRMAILEYLPTATLRKVGRTGLVIKKCQLYSGTMLPRSVRLLVAALVVMLENGVANAQSPTGPDLVGVESEPLKAGLTAFEDLDYPKALEQFRLALRESLTKRERVVLFRAQALIHSALDDSLAAIADFERVLRINPLFELDRNTSPKVRRAFFEAKANLAKQALAPPLNATRSPERPKVGESLALTVLAPSGTERIELYFRSRGDTSYQLIISGTPTRGQPSELVIPQAAIDSDAVEYHLRAVNDLDQTVGADGTLANPLSIPVQGGKPKRGAPLIVTVPATGPGVSPAPNTTPNATVVAKPPEKKKTPAWVWGVVAGGIVVVGAIAIGLGVGLTRNRNATIEARF